MLTSLGTETKTRNDQIPLQKNAPVGWAPLEIVFTRVTFVFDENDPNNKKLIFQGAPSSLEVASTDVVKFVNDLLSGTIAPGTLKVPRSSPGVPPPGAVDILVDKRSYVVVELDPAIDWQFRTRDVGVTAKEDYGDDNCSLYHVNGKDDFTAGAPTRDGCRIVFFSVVRRTIPLERQHFNLHVEFLQPGANSIEIIIDPDVPNNGGIFQFDPLAPLAPAQP